VDLDRIRHFLRQYPKETRANLQTALTEFLNPADVKVRSYVFRLLHAHLCVEAGHLREDTIEILRKTSQLRPSYSVFIDTNFLFSILSLHSNPSNEAANSLLLLIGTLAERVPIKLYILPLTAQEAKNALISAKSWVQGIPVTENLTRVALKASLSGMAQKYFEERGKGGGLF